MNKKKDWLNEFIEKNGWAIFILIASIIFFFGGYFASSKSQVQANTNNISEIKKAITDIVQNQKDIIVLQQQDKSINNDIDKILKDLECIKKSMGLL